MVAASSHEILVDSRVWESVEYFNSKYHNDVTRSLEFVVPCHSSTDYCSSNERNYLEAPSFHKLAASRCYSSVRFGNEKEASDVLDADCSLSFDLLSHTAIKYCLTRMVYSAVSR